MKKVLLTISIVILILCSAFAANADVLHDFDNNSNLTIYQQIMKKHRQEIHDLLGKNYTAFLNCISKIDAIDINYCCSRFRDGNNILLVGSSGVVHIGCALENELDKYHVDVLGVGGTTDEFMLDWLQYINKRYDKIIILNGVNNINLCCEYDYPTVGKDFVEDVKRVCDSYKSLLKQYGKIAYITPIPYKEYSSDYEIKYNSFANKLIPDLKSAGVPLLEVDYQIDDGLHSKNKELFVKIVTCLNNDDREDLYKLVEKEYTEQNHDFYNSIENSISKKNIYSNWQTYFEKDNKNLIVGCSPVTYMNLYGKKYIKKFGYDLISFGGVRDKEITTWFEHLNKKYDRIVIWCAVNDIFSAVNSETVLSAEYFHTLDTLLAEAKKHLNSNSADSLFFINAKELSISTDMPLPEYCYKYNIEANRVNEYIKEKMIKSIDVIFPTDKQHSEWYIHYIDEEVYNYLLSNIELLDPK